MNKYKMIIIFISLFFSAGVMADTDHPDVAIFVQDNNTTLTKNDIFRLIANSVSESHPGVLVSHHIYRNTKYFIIATASGWSDSTNYANTQMVYANSLAVTLLKVSGVSKNKHILYSLPVSVCDTAHSLGASDMVSGQDSFETMIPALMSPINEKININ